MKKLKFTCSNCQAKLRVPTHLAGVSAPCPKCGETITAPSDVTLAEEDEPSSAGHEAIQKEPVHAGVSAQTTTSPAVAGVQVGAAVSNKASAPVQQPRSRVVASPPPVSAALDEKVEDVAQRPTYGQSIPIPIPPAPTPAELAEAALDEERAAAEAPPEIHEGEMPVSLDDIAVPVTESVVQPVAPVEPEMVQPAAAAPVAEVPAPKAMEETQPIRITAQPRNLPESTNAPAPEGRDLPRLDVSLGEQNAAATAAEMVSPDGIVPREPTKVQLPSPGDASHQDTPDDFIIPGDLNEPIETAVQQEIAQPINEPSVEVPASSAENDLIDLSAGQFASSLPQQIENAPLPDADPMDQVAPAEPASVSELLGLDGFEPEYPPSTSAAPPVPAETQVASAAPEISQQHEIPVSAALPEQVETVLQDPAEYGQSIAPEVAPHGVAEQFSSPVAQSTAEPLSPNPIAASAGSAHPETIPSQEMSAAQVRSEADVLDDMFGGSESGGSFSLNIKLIILAGAALLAIVAVLLAVNALGGWSVADPATADSVIKPITPEKSVEPEKSEVVLTPDPGMEPSIDDAPAVIDPIAQDLVAEASRAGSTIAMPGDTSTPVKIMDSSGNLRDPVQEATDSIKSAQDSADSAMNDGVAKVDSAALSFDEKVQSIVNGNGAGLSVIGGVSPVTSPDAGSGVMEGSTSLLPGSESGASAAGTAKNYNPEPFYPAPTDESDLLGKTHELIDAFLRAPDWESRLRYTYQGDSLKPAVQSYYQKWEERPVNRFSLQLFQREIDPEMGGPYWVYLISTSDDDQGFPLIVRVEDEKLKVDWEIFSEFYDRHFVRFRSGEIPGPATFRLVIERMSDYYGADRDGFKDLDDYYVYQINPPYGDLNEFSEYAFVKKDSEVAKSLDAVVGLGEEPLAVIITLDKSSFAHGIKHFVISEYVTEGWFR